MCVCACVSMSFWFSRQGAQFLYKESKHIWPFIAGFAIMNYVFMTIPLPSETREATAQEEEEEEKQFFVNKKNLFLLFFCSLKRRSEQSQIMRSKWIISGIARSTTRCSTTRSTATDTTITTLRPRAASTRSRSTWRNRLPVRPHRAPSRATTERCCGSEARSMIRCSGSPFVWLSS
jgi:hypothetical protein